MPFWPVNSFYFVTSKVFLGEKLFNTDEKKRIILNQIRGAIDKLNIPIYGYSIAQNHYHSLLYFNDFRKHAKFKQIVNGGSAFIFNKKYRIKNESAKMWVDSKSLVVHNQQSLFKVIGYIAGNLLKHGEVNNFKELKECPFSSYRQLVGKYGDEIAEDIVKAVIVIEEDESDFLVDLSKLNSH
jgi:hypothetical protein